MKQEKNKLQLKYSEIAKLIKTRGGSLTKDQFFNNVADLLTEDNIDSIIHEYSPAEYPISAKMTEFPSYKQKVLDLYEAETGLKV